MLRKRLILFMVVVILLAGCKDVDTSFLETAENPVISTPLLFTPTQELAQTTQPASPTASEMPVPTIPSPTSTPLPPTLTPTLTSSSTNTFPPEARVTSQCLVVEPTVPLQAESDTILVLDRLIDVGSYGIHEIYLLDMANGLLTQIARPNEYFTNFIISADRQIVAFRSVLWNEARTASQTELVIAASSGERLVTLPWEKEWLAINSWSDSQNLIISYLENGDNTQRIASLLILNPFSGERQLLSPPDFSDVAPAFPWFSGWRDAVYNATLTRAVYPRYLEDDQELYTYAIWDLSSQQLVTSLEDIFTNFTTSYKNSPVLRWSPDGTQFVFEAYRVDQEPPIPTFELYRVSQDGQSEQITHLTSILFLSTFFSWSPDGQYIASPLTKWGQPLGKSRAMVLNMQTLEITDYCLFINPGLNAPIWSPDSSQFVVVDWTADESHNRVILVDIARSLAAVVAEDMAPVGWMKPPP